MPCSLFVRSLHFGLIFLIIAAYPRSGRCADPTFVWRTDYNSARKESQETGLPMLLQIGSENCVYCKKMDVTTFRDPAVIAQMANFIPLKIDGNRDQQLVKVLKVQLYPTTVLAAPDGTIHAFVQGYVAVDQFKEQLRRTTDLVAATNKIVRPVVEALKKSGTTLLASQSKALLETARELHKSGSYAEAWEICTLLEPTAEGLSALLLVNEMRSTPAQLAAVSKMANAKAAALQLSLAEQHIAQGNTRDATACYELAVQLNPNQPRVKTVEAQLTKLKVTVPVVPAVIKKE